MLYLTCTTITSVGLAHYGVSRAKDWVSVDCGTISHIADDIALQKLQKTKNICIRTSTVLSNMMHMHC